MAIDWNDPNLETKGLFEGMKWKAKLLGTYSDPERITAKYIVLLTSEKGEEWVSRFNDEGHCYGNANHPGNLHNPPKEEWVNIWENRYGALTCSGSSFPSKEKAEAMTCGNGKTRIATVRIK